MELAAMIMSSTFVGLAVAAAMLTRLRRETSLELRLLVVAAAAAGVSAVGMIVGTFLRIDTYGLAAEWALLPSAFIAAVILTGVILVSMFLCLLILSLFSSVKRIPTATALDFHPSDTGIAGGVPQVSVS